MDLLGERMTGSPDLNSRHDPVTSWLARTGLDTPPVTVPRPDGPRSNVDDDDIIVMSLVT